MFFSNQKEQTTDTCHSINELTPKTWYVKGDRHKRCVSAFIRNIQKRQIYKSRRISGYLGLEVGVGSDCK